MCCDRLREHCFRGYHPILPQALRSIQAPVGFQYQLLGAADAIVKQDGNATADTDMACRGGILMGDSQLLYRVFGGFSDL